MVVETGQDAEDGLEGDWEEIRIGPQTPQWAKFGVGRREAAAAGLRDERGWTAKKIRGSTVSSVGSANRRRCFGDTTIELACDGNGGEMIEADELGMA